MIGPSLLTGLFLGVLAAGTADAQAPCPVGVNNNNLICLIPGVFGAAGLTSTASEGGATFAVDFQSTALKLISSATARQAALTPIASPSSGVSYSWDPVAKVFIASNESLGPILGERAAVIGKSKLFLGFDYEDLAFVSLDGHNLKTLPVILTPSDVPLNDGSGTICSISGTNPAQNTGSCGFIRDVMVTQNRLDLRIHEFTTFITYGITSRVAVSLVIPIETVRIAMTSNVTISHNDSSSSFHNVFPSHPGCPAPCLQNTFSDSGTATGFSDVTLRIKAVAWTNENAGLSLGADVRTPTGDALNLLGSGAAGVKPFIVWSYRSWISPHGFVGYELNGSSITAGDVSTGTKARVPGQLTYAGGADMAVNRRLTVAVDLVGQEVFQAPRTVSTTFVEPGQCQDSPAQQCDPALSFLPPKQDPNLAETTGAFNITNLALGLKSNPFSTFLLTGNVSVKLNNGGLRARVVPLVGFSYTF